MKQNVVIFVIDSLRADKCYGINKHLAIPNISSLIHNGIYFKQAISCADGTALALGSIFTGLYPFKNGINTYVLKSNTQNYFNHLRKHGYYIYSTIPQSITLAGLISNFGNIDQKFHFQSTFLRLNEGYGKEIISRLENNVASEPWIHFIHLKDLHWPRIIPSQFDNVKFGDNEYEKMMSVIDFWMGQFIKKIDFERTLLILTADHGEYIPVKEKRDLDYKPTLEKTITVGNKILPQHLHPHGKRIIVTLRNKIQKIRFKIATRNLTEHEKRTLLTRAGWFLYDDLIRIPLIFSGSNIKKQQIIEKQVTNVDIFPTILNLIGIPQLSTQVHGKSLVPLINNEHFSESSVYLESALVDTTKNMGNVIGIRTPQYKYFRSRESTQKHVHLFNLINDPSELNNLYNSENEILKQMEIELSKFILDSNISSQKDEHEMKKIENELKKLGYL